MKLRPFPCLSLLTALLYLWLAIQLLFTPTSMLESFGVAAEPHAINLAQRISALMVGFSVLAVIAVWIPSSAGRGAIAVAIAVNMGGFAVNSFWGAAHGILTDGAIPFIGGIETGIAIAFASFAVLDLIIALRRELHAS